MEIAEITAFLYSLFIHAEVCAILIRNKGNVDVKMKNGATPPFQRVQNGHVHISTVLLQNNINVSEDSATSLFPAAQNGHVDVYIVLLKNNANVNRK